jgi:hypothetical protein
VTAFLDGTMLRGYVEDFRVNRILVNAAGAAG